MGKVFFFLLFSLTAFAAGEAPFPIRQRLRHDFRPAASAIPVALLDADQTVRISTSKWRAPRQPNEVLILPEVEDKIRELNQRGFFVAIISNQESPVRDTGPELIERTMAETVRQLELHGARVNYVDYSVTAPEAKPSPQMFRRLEAKLRAAYGPNTSVDLGASFMVGDAAYLEPRPGFAGERRPNGRLGLDTSNFDRKFAENSGLKFYEPQAFFGWEKFGVERFSAAGQIPRYLARKANSGCPAAFRGLIVAP